MLLRNEAELYFGTCENGHSPMSSMSSAGGIQRKLCNAPLELVREGLLVEQNIRVSVPLVELLLHLPDAAHRAIGVAIPGKDDERCVGVLVSQKSVV